jgi:hypothetical protein
MYKDIINYELAEGITQDHLLEVAEIVATQWMQQQEGFVSWEIHINPDGSYTDIVSWKSQIDAKNSESDMGNIPNAADWYGCYKEGTISSKNITQIANF